MDYYPILIEYKGHKNRLEKLNKDNKIDNITSKNEANYKKY